MRIQKICVLGGTGFVGTQLVTALNKAGKDVKVITRKRERNRHLLVLPRVDLVEADVYATGVLKREFTGMDAVINLIGILNEKGHSGDGFRKSHVDLTKSIVQACMDKNVHRLLHMSALNADAGRGSSHYLRSKGEAENHAHTFSGPRLAVTSFRPSVIFGLGDSLFNRFATLLKIMPILPLACPKSRFAPVHVGDVVQAFMNSLEDTQSIGKHFNLVGPQIYTLKELAQYTARCLGRNCLIIGLPNWLSKLQANLMEFVPGKPFSRDNYHSLQQDNICDTATPQPTCIDAVVPAYLGSASVLEQYQAYRRTAHR